MKMTLFCGHEGKKDTNRGKWKVSDVTVGENGMICKAV